MKLIRHIALTTMLTVGAFSVITYTSCNKDNCKNVVCENGGTCNSTDGSCTCPTGYSGSTCGTAVRTTYVGTYKGNGSDNNGGSYSGWSMVFATSGTDAKAMSMTLLDANNAAQLAFTVTLATNTTFTVDAKTNGNYSYTGSGSIDGNTASLTLTETDNTTSNVLVYTFSNMLKQ